MRILIIEDEMNAALDLQQMLLRCNPQFEILSITDSIESTLEWLLKNQMPELIFSDIQLADGLSFEVFQQHPVACPVIFTTAYDEYAIQAFDANGIGYLLKPTDEKKLIASLKKVEMLRNTLTRPDDYPPNLYRLLKSFQIGNKTYKTSLLISFKGKIFPLPVTEVACFVIRNGVTYVYTNTGKSYVISQTLDDLEVSLNPVEFYRANRQYLVAFKAIKEGEPYLGRRILIHVNIQLDEKIIVSKPRSQHFIAWLENR